MIFLVNKIKNSKLRFNHAFCPWKRLFKWALTCWVILPKEYPRRFLITPFPFPKPTHVKASHQVKFIPSSSHPHLNPSLFLSHLTVCALSSFLIFFIFFLSQNATASSCLSIYFHLFCSYIHIPKSSYSYLFTFCFPSNTACASSFSSFFFTFVFWPNL